jgi:hypothetical protein
MNRKNLFYTVPAIAAGVTQTDAGVVLHTLATPLSCDYSNQWIYFNLTTGDATTTYDGSLDGVGAFTIYAKSYSGFFYSWSYAYSGDSTYYTTAYTTIDLSTYAALFNSGSTIDGALNFNSSPTVDYYNGSTITLDGNADGTHYYMGFTFGDATSTYYGWAEVSIASDGVVTLYSMAYDSVAGTAIITGVPEPSDSAALAGLLAGSAAAFGAIRRRKNKAKAA